MEKGKSPALFVNDGSFMERFKQLQEENRKSATKLPPTVSGAPVPKHVISKTGSVSKVNDSRKPSTNASGGKLAFSLKQKSKLVAPPVKLDEDEEEERDDGYSSGNGSTKRQKVGQSDAPVQPTKGVDVGFTSPATVNNTVHQKPHQQQLNYQIPASALYEAPETDPTGRSGYGESTAPTSADPIAMMEFYMKKAAQEEKKRQPKQSKDEMPPPASLQGPDKRGHHMGDYIPLEELNKFMSSCNDVAAQKAAQEAADRAKIQADNIGHKLLSKMGWKEGEGLGSSRSGIADPISAGNVKIDNLGVGASKPGEVKPDDDIYEQYKKRMMLGYRYRPNPMVYIYILLQL
uniref:G-patch domain-containing protein n=1 Tax=Daucus carota subsp. sativus TaxID=79200 RepID=A0A175YFJ2_DAUCS